MSKIIKLYKNENTPYYVNADKIEYFYTNESGAVGVVFSETAVYFYAETEESIYLKINGIENYPVYDIGEKYKAYRYKQENEEKYICLTVSTEQFYHYGMKAEIFTNGAYKFIRTQNVYEVEIVGIERENLADGTIDMSGTKPTSLSYNSGFVCVTPYDCTYEAFGCEKDLYKYTYYAKIKTIQGADNDATR